MLYRPSLSVTMLRVFSMSAGLDASTVTPGSTAPDVSLTTPAMPLADACCADANDGSSRTPVMMPAPRRAMVCAIGCSSCRLPGRVNCRGESQPIGKPSDADTTRPCVVKSVNGMGSLFSQSSPSQHRTHAPIVAFVAGELEEIERRILLERKRDRPRFGPRRRIVDGDLVAKRAIVDSRETLGHTCFMGERAVDAASLAEVGRIHDQCGSFPPSTRVAHVAE